jgi:hypothetical protein
MPVEDTRQYRRLQSQDAALSTIFRRGSKRSCTRQLLILLKPNAQVKITRVLEAFPKSVGSAREMIALTYRRVNTC